MKITYKPLMDLLFENTYGDFVLSVKEDKEYMLHLFIDNELVAKFHSDHLIEYKTHEHIPEFISEYCGENIVKQFCQDADNFAKQWQW